jgi:Lrp/AsnC family transcriptional regulator for asnA, asnC and gidA
MQTMQRDIDDLDRRIILELQEDARRPFKVVANTLEVSQGTIRNRVKRLIEKGVLKLEARVNPFSLPNKIAAVVALTLMERNHEEIMKKIEDLPNVTSVWNATGRYDLFFEVMVDSLNELNNILFLRDLSSIGGIDKTETFVLLSSRTKDFKLPRVSG